MNPQSEIVNDIIRVADSVRVLAKLEDPSTWRSYIIAKMEAIMILGATALIAKDRTT